MLKMDPSAAGKRLIEHIKAEPECLPWLGASLLIWFGGLVLLLILAGGLPVLFSAGAQTASGHFMGDWAASWAGVLYNPAGLGAWWLIWVFLLAGLMVLKVRRPKSWLGLICGGLWLILATGAIFSLAWSRLALGGEGGASIALGLYRQGGILLAWGAPGLIALIGLAATVWSAWPVLGPYLEPTPEEIEAAAQEASEAGEAQLQEEPEAPVPFDPGGQSGSGALPPLDEDHEPMVDIQINTPPPLEPMVDLGEGQPDPAQPPQAEAPRPPQAQTEPQPEPPAQGPVIRPRLQEPETLADDDLPPETLEDSPFTLPGISFMQEVKRRRTAEHDDLLRDNSKLLEKKLLDFKVEGKVVAVAPGPVVTMYEFKPAPGIKISKVSGLSDDLALNLRARSVRIVAPIPGKDVIGIEIPSPRRETVYLRELLASPVYLEAKSNLSVALGKDILGMPVVDDLSRMPHLLIAGATGSGKSVFVNTLVLSILYRATPDQVRLLMVDPKRIELSPYNHIPHLLYPVISDPDQACAGLRWAVQEMERRYELLAATGVRHITSYNQRLEEQGITERLSVVLDPDDPESYKPLPFVVIIIDELADLMMVSSKEVEALITRLAQKARAAGIHLVVATQRPSVDVITGLIKANFPARISFQVSQKVDSRTILDQQGAEHLLGKGDMLFMPPGTAGLTRLHGALVTDNEIEQVAEFLRAQGRPKYDERIVQTEEEETDGFDFDDAPDELYPQAVSVVTQSGQASISYVQRRLRVGYNRAARMIERMEREGIVGPSDGSKSREVLIRE